MDTMTSETGKLPQGWSHVLKPSALGHSLDAAGLTINTHLVRGQGRGFIDAHFWPPERIPYERLYVVAGAVSKEQAQDARRFVEQEGLPNLIAWISSILNQDPASPGRRERQSLRITIPANL